MNFFEMSTNRGWCHVLRQVPLHWGNLCPSADIDGGDRYDLSAKVIKCYIEENFNHILCLVLFIGKSIFVVWLSTTGCSFSILYDKEFKIVPDLHIVITAFVLYNESGVRQHAHSFRTHPLIIYVAFLNKLCPAYVLTASIFYLSMWELHYGAKHPRWL